MADNHSKVFDMEIRGLEEKIVETKDRDIITYQSEIKELLELEIASRYFIEREAMEATFEKDPDILEAVKVLSDMKLYRKILQTIG